jgi:uncharacterized protein YndB with AHSA1/START domain
MVSQPTEFSASTEVAAPPEKVWALVSDITRIGEWSPECVRAEWHDGASAPAVGVGFTGTNKAGDFEWSVPCEITDCVPGSVFAFVAPADMDPTTDRSLWRYEFAASPGGCTVTESFHAPLLNIEGSPANVEGRYEGLCGAVEQTLANIKAAAEA